MVEVPTLEQQRAKEEFRYRHIILVLFSQTKFDNVMRKYNRKKSQRFDTTSLKEFPKMTDFEQTEFYKHHMPQRLRDMIFVDFEIPDEV